MLHRICFLIYIITHIFSHIFQRIYFFAWQVQEERVGQVRGGALPLQPHLLHPRRPVPPSTPKRNGSRMGLVQMFGRAGTDLGRDGPYINF